MTFRGITICVDYHDILSLTYEYNREFFAEFMVVTSEQDTRTQEFCIANEIRCHVTDAFYRRGAIFNKWAALEEGLDVFGRHGWMCLLDADVVLPKARPAFQPKIGNIYTPRRRIWDPIPNKIPNEKQWRTMKRTLLREEFAGYCQMFHASDPLLAKTPWHETDWTWAGGADSFFHMKWSDRQHVRPPFECLHLGKPFENWAGRVSPFLDGTVPEDAEKRSGMRAMLLNARKSNNRQNRYLAEKLK